MGNIWLLWDLVAVCILIYFVGQCAAKGLVRTLISLFSYVIAALGARALSVPAARFLYDNVVEDILRLVITGQLETQLADGSIGAVVDAVPKSLQRIIQQSGSGIAEALFDGDVAAMVDTFIQEALQDPVVSLLQSICFFVLFGLLLTVTRRLGGIFNGFYRIPVFGTLNTLLGGIVGVFEGVLALYLTCILMKATITLTGGELQWLNEQVLDQTFVFRTFYHFS